MNSIVDRKGLGRTPQATRDRGGTGRVVRSGRPVQSETRGDTRKERDVRRKKEEKRGKEMWIGTANIMSLTGRVEELVDVMLDKKLKMLGMSETKWKGTGKKALRGGYVLYWSGGKERRNGVGIMVSKEMEECIEKVDMVNERIIKVRIRVDGRTLDVIQVYAPQVGNKDLKIQEFLEIVERNIENKSTIVMGDMNAHVGTERGGMEEVIGPYGWGGRNEEGKELMKFCERNDLIIGNSWFQKKASKRVTRIGWGQKKVKSVIDYILVEREMRKELMDVKVVAEEAVEGGDHRLVMAKLRIGRIPQTREWKERKIKVWKLKEETVMREFAERIRESLPKGEIKSVEEEWGQFKETMVKVAERVCGRNGGRWKEKESKWWNSKVKEAVKKKKEAWKRWRQSQKERDKQRYDEEKRECKKVVRKERRKCWEEFTEELKKDAEGNKKMLYRIVKRRRTTREESKYVKDENGNVVVKKNEILWEWKNWFETLLNPRRKKEKVETRQGKEEEKKSVAEGTYISMREIEVAMKKMKGGKAPGVDEIPIELIKAAGAGGMHWVYRIFRAVWKEKKVPGDWKKGIIVPIFKKGDRMKCENYRGITLLPHTMKLFERVMENRIRGKVEDEMEEEQMGFRWGRSTVDAIFTLRMEAERKWKYGKKMVMSFLDISKAYDSIKRETVWKEMEKRKMNEWTIHMIKEMYEGSRSCVKTKVGRTEWFEIDNGVRQGSVLSPLLFIMVMDGVQKEVKKREGGSTRSMLFADDLVIWGEEEEDVSETIKAWSEEIGKCGMEFNEEKSKVVVQERKKDGVRVKGVNMNGTKLEEVKEYKYLGTIFSEDGKVEKEIGARVKQASGFYQSVRGLVWDREVPLECKKVMYKTYFVPILTYAAETWAEGSRERSRIQAAEMKFLRSMVRKTRYDRVRNEDVREQLEVESLMERVGRAKIKWFGHVWRMGEERMPRKMMEEEKEKRPRGRPRDGWIRIVKREIEKRCDIERAMREKWYLDRERWREVGNGPTRGNVEKGKR